MKRRISTLIVVAILVVVLAMSFAGCSAPVEKAEGVKDLNEAISNTKNATQFYLRNVYVLSDNHSIEIQLNSFMDEEKNKEAKRDHAIKVTLVESDLANTTYASLFWGDSLKVGAKKKKATDADWKRGYMIVPNQDEATKKDTPMFLYPMADFEEFLDFYKYIGTDKRFEEPLSKNPGKNLVKKFADEGWLEADFSIGSLSSKLEEFMLTEQGQNPTSVKRQGRVTTYVYDDIGVENASKFGKANTEGKNPLLIETINGHISKITDGAKGKYKYYLTMQGPNIDVPKWTESGLRK